MRGEYKVPDGKLVTVEFGVIDGRLSDVHVAGDFFLEPDSALDDINAALTGLPADTSVGELERAVTAGLDAGVVMLGLDATAIGVAVRRALGAATSWYDHTFDLIGPVTLDPVMHVALDEALSHAVAEGRRGPLLRIWDWDSSVVVIGSFQSVKNEIDSEAAAEHEIGVVRRISGGGAMFMEPGNCITYSLIVPPSLVEGLSFVQSYRFLDAWVMDALASVGVNAHYEPINDIVSDKGKIGGAAQKRLASGAVLHHVTMSYDIDAEKMTQVLRIGREKLSGKGIRSAVKRVDPMRSQTGMARAEIIEKLMTTFREHYDVRESAYTEAELAEARRLAETKFLTDEWTYRVP